MSRRRTSCTDCPKRRTCTEICPDIERLLDGHDSGSRADLNRIDRSVTWSVQDIEDELPRRQRMLRNRQETVAC